MSVLNSLDKRTQTLKHKQDLKNLKNLHTTELDRIKLKHDKHKNQVKTSNKMEEINLRTEQEIKLAKQVDKNEKTLDKLKKSLSDVEIRTNKEKELILNGYEKEKTNTDASHENLLRSKKVKNELLLQDMDHQAKIQIGKIQRKIDAKETQLRNEGNQELGHIKALSSGKIETNKATYAKKEFAQSNKFQSALLQQKERNTNQITDQEKKHQSKLAIRENRYEKEFENKTIDHTRKMGALAKNHETKYGEIYNKNEQALQRLAGKKEKIIEYVRQFVKKEAVKEMEKNEDSFYHYTGLNPTVEVNKEKTGYNITIPAPEYEAKNIQLVGFDRQLKLTMDRDFDYKTTEEDGSTTNLKKNETLTSKIPIDYIVNPKSVTRNYQDGNLIFKIDFA